jgi:hypothetical protein
MADPDDIPHYTAPPPQWAEKPSSPETMIGRIARAMTTTLRHHGVEMHPDDIKGLAWDAFAVMREPTEAMTDAGGDRAQLGFDPAPGAVWRAMIDAAREEG